MFIIHKIGLKTKVENIVFFKIYYMQKFDLRVYNILRNIYENTKIIEEYKKFKV